MAALWLGLAPDGRAPRSAPPARHFRSPGSQARSCARPETVMQNRSPPNPVTVTVNGRPYRGKYVVVWRHDGGVSSPDFCTRQVAVLIGPLRRAEHPAENGGTRLACHATLHNMLLCRSVSTFNPVMCLLAGHAYSLLSFVYRPDQRHPARRALSRGAYSPNTLRPPYWCDRARSSTNSASTGGLLASTSSRRACSSSRLIASSSSD